MVPGRKKINLELAINSSASNSLITSIPNLNKVEPKIKIDYSSGDFCTLLNGFSTIVNFQEDIFSGT